MRAKALGVPDLALVVVRHPLADLSRDEVVEVAEQCHQQVAMALLGGQAPAADPSDPGTQEGTT